MQVEDRIQRKCGFILKVVLWCVVLIVNSGISLPGIIIALQYRSDNCVTSTNYWNIFLDYWLLFGAIFQLALPFFTLPCVCCHFESNLFRYFMIVNDILLTGWVCLGLFLITRSDLRTCSHDSLWVMSIVFLVIISTILVIQITYAVIKIVNHICVTQEIQYQQIWNSDVQSLNGVGSQESNTFASTATTNSFQ